MRQMLISERVNFKRHVQGWRYWCMNGQKHRDDGGPACEYMSDGYCSWHEHGKFIRNNR